MRRALFILIALLLIPSTFAATVSTVTVYTTTEPASEAPLKYYEQYVPERGEVIFGNTRSSLPTGAKEISQTQYIFARDNRAAITQYQTEYSKYTLSSGGVTVFQPTGNHYTLQSGALTFYEDDFDVITQYSSEERATLEAENRLDFTLANNPDATYAFGGQTAGALVVAKSPPPTAEPAPAPTLVPVKIEPIPEGTGPLSYYEVERNGELIFVAVRGAAPASATRISAQQYNYAAKNKNLIRNYDPSLGKFILNDNRAVFFSGTGQYYTLTPTNQMTLYDEQGDVIGRYDAATKASIESKFGLDFTQSEDAKITPTISFMSIASQFHQQGIDIKYATKVSGKEAYYYKSTFTGDIYVERTRQNNADVLTLYRGTLKYDAQGNPTGEFDTRQAHTQTRYENGEFRERAEFGAGGTQLSLYQFGPIGGTWSVQVYNKEIGRLEKKGEGEVILTPKGPVCACGLLDGKKFGVNVLNGQVVLEDGTPLTTEQLNALNDDQKALVAAAKELHQEYLKQQANAWERVWTEGNLFDIASFLFSTYENWRGLGAYGSLFIGKEDLAKRRARMNEQFCKIGLGIDCITSELCERYSDKHSGDNTIITVIPGQAVRAAAHVQAQRTEATSFKNASGSYKQWLYHITFYASSPDDDNAVQLRFQHQDGHYDWFPAPGTPVKKGGAASAQGRAALIKYSLRDYTQVCLIYTQSIDTGKGRQGTLCVPVVDTTPRPDSPAPETPAEAAQTAEAGPQAPTTTPGEGF